jgi:hypothetical protein
MKYTVAPRTFQAHWSLNRKVVDFVVQQLYLWPENGFSISMPEQEISRSLWLALLMRLSLSKKIPLLSKME